MKPKYSIGDLVWYARWDQEKVYETCPECGGTKHLRVILWDGTEHTIDCEGCKEGYYGPSGRVHRYERTPRAEQLEIIGVEVQEYREVPRVEYRLRAIGGGNWCPEEARLFLTKEEALACATTAAAEETEAEKQKVLRKVKEHRSWSWHVHYHRRAVRDAQKNIEYHSKCLDVAKAKAKEPEAE